MSRPAVLAEGSADIADIVVGIVRIVAQEC